MKNNQSILKKIENLLKPESTILVDLHKKIDDNTNTALKKEKSISTKNQKITNIKSEIDALNKEKDILLEAFNSLKDTDLKLITSVLKLNVDVDKDLNKLTNQLPLQIEIRNNDINDLESAIKEDEEKLISANNNVNIYQEKLDKALEDQKVLSDLIKEASSGSCIRTRNEVTEILKNLDFSKDEAYTAAKLIMFPEDELMPYFKNFKFDADVLDDNETYVDLDNIVEALKEVDLDENKETKKESSEEAKETDTKTEEEKPVLEDDNDNFFSSFGPDMFDFNDNTKEKEIVEEEADDKTCNDAKLNEEKEEDYQKKLEDETPISFEELKNLFEDDTETKEEIKEAEPKDSEEGIISFDELQSKMNDIFGSLNTNSSDIENTKEIKEEETNEKEIAENNDANLVEDANFDTKVLEKLKKSASDIALIKPFDTSKIDYDNIKELASDRNIELANIPLVAYKNGVENYLDNVVSLHEFGYKPSDAELQKNGAVLCLVSNEDMKKNLKTLEDYKIDLKMPNGRIAFNPLTLEPTELVRRIDLILENNQSDLLTYDVNALSLDVYSILKRILFCNEYNIPYTEEKNNVLTYNSYVFRQDILEELVEKEVPIDKDINKLTSDLSKVVDSKLIDILDTNLNDIFNIKLSDAGKFDEYTRLEQKLESICVCKGNTYIIDGLSFSYQNTKRNLITLINNTTDEADKDILIASLLYNSTKSIEDAKNVLESL